MTYRELAAADRAEWLEQRHAGIGASEVAAVMGRSPWTSPFDLYWRKRSDVHESGGNEYTAWGHRLEPVIAGHFAEQHPEFEVFTSVGLCVNDDRPWQRCSPDGLVAESDDVLNAVAGLEVKNAHDRGGWDVDDLQGVPLHYYDQVQWSMDVTGLPVWWVAALFGGNTYAEYEVVYDETHAKALREQASAFWDTVTQRRPPPLDSHDATARRLRELHPDVDDVEVHVDNDLAVRYVDACAAVKRATDRKKLVENELRDALGSGRVAVTASGAKVATRSVYDVERFDVKAFRADHPDLADKYARPSTVHKLTPPRQH